MPSLFCPDSVVDTHRSLHVLVSHSVVRNELFFHRQSILAKIKALPGCAAVRGLVLRSG
ncbi:MAG: hypothetical protein HY302_05165 [Opitutae bacterium]|nr:hypothetical protein [Opitutae bacterium]